MGLENTHLKLFTNFTKYIFLTIIY